nr:hypothetical protein [uncultured Methanoregula sp.]
MIVLMVEGLKGENRDGSGGGAHRMINTEGGIPPWRGSRDAVPIDSPAGSAAHAGQAKTYGRESLRW